MLLNGAKKHKLELENCVVIRDRWSDIAGSAALREHYHKIKDIEIKHMLKI